MVGVGLGVVVHGKRRSKVPKGPVNMAYLCTGLESA